MTLTRVNIHTVHGFIQPAVGDTVTVRLDPSIDWIVEGELLYISKGGVYWVEDILGFMHTLKLVRAIKETGELVETNLVWPIPPYVMLSESSVIKHINWNGGSQIFDIGEQYVDSTLKVWVNGQLIVPPQYNPFGLEGKFEILDQLQSSDKIVIEYYIL